MKKLKRLGLAARVLWCLQGGMVRGRARLAPCEAIEREGGVCLVGLKRMQASPVSRTAAWNCGAKAPFSPPNCHGHPASFPPWRQPRVVGTSLFSLHGAVWWCVFVYPTNSPGTASFSPIHKIPRLGGVAQW
jgi:hypothetical protein